MIHHAHYTDNATERLVRSFLATTRRTIHGYSEAAARNKARFHRLGKVLLRCIAWDLGYAPGMFAVRNNYAGAAVSGDIILHADELYVQFCKSRAGDGSLDILYRTCQGRTDYSGGPSRFLPFAALEDYGQTLALLSALKAEARP